jgi:F-type H+-transporting ATPase subunit b
MRRNSRVRFAVSLLVLCLCLAVNACAADEGGSAANGSANEIFKWVNFAIVAALLIWVFGKKLPPLFHQNAERISAAIDKAKAAKEEAERQVQDAERKLAQLEQEVAALKTKAQKESAAEAERIRVLAESEAKKVDAAAQGEIAAAEHAARLHLKALAAGLAVDGAESLLAKRLTPAAQETLVDAFVSSLDGRPN